MEIYSDCLIAIISKKTRLKKSNSSLSVNFTLSTK
nr:MAG TPA: hypothetical protein [Caudoviricetes sp.]